MLVVAIARRLHAAGGQAERDRQPRQRERHQRDHPERRHDLGHARRRAEAGDHGDEKDDEEVELANERGIDIPIRAADKMWVPVVVIDHPGLESYLPTSEAVVLLRRDWEFLFEQLKSTYAVVEYLARVHGRPGAINLGHEAIRYYELAAADMVAPPGPLNPRLGTEGRSAPLLPQAPAPSSNLVRVMLEDIAAVAPSEGHDPAARLDSIAAVDAVPVGVRLDLAETVLNWLDEVAKTEEGTTRWWFRRMIWPDRPYLIFGAATRHNELVGDSFTSYVSLRHQQMLELIPERTDVMTVGVLTPRTDGLRQWDTSMAATRGDQHFEPDLRAALERLWGGLGSDTKHSTAAVEGILDEIGAAIDAEQKESS